MGQVRKSRGEIITYCQFFLFGFLKMNQALLRAHNSPNSSKRTEKLTRLSWKAFRFLNTETKLMYHPWVKNKNSIKFNESKIWLGCYF